LGRRNDRAQCLRSAEGPQSLAQRRARRETQNARGLMAVEQGEYAPDEIGIGLCGPAQILSQRSQVGAIAFLGGDRCGQGKRPVFPMPIEKETPSGLVYGRLLGAESTRRRQLGSGREFAPAEFGGSRDQIAGAGRERQHRQRSATALVGAPAADAVLDARDSGRIERGQSEV
jgi:hypothetical protein